jgi:hypothetical protein
MPVGQPQNLLSLCFDCFYQLDTLNYPSVPTPVPSRRPAAPGRRR